MISVIDKRQKNIASISSLKLGEYFQFDLSFHIYYQKVSEHQAIKYASSHVMVTIIEFSGEEMVYPINADVHVKIEISESKTR